MGSNVLNGVSAKLEKVPAVVIDDVIRRFTDIAEHEGGRVARTQLTAEPEHRQVAAGSGSVTMVGRPAGYWVWRERGTRPHLIRAHSHEPLALSGHPVWGPVHHPGTHGHGAWTKTVNRAERELNPASTRALGAMS